MTHASEAGHWYDADGKPVYEVPAAKGGLRPTTLRDARKLNLVPSVTGIIRMMAAPGLERWKQTQVLHAALTLPKIEGESEESYLDRIMRDSGEQARKAAERGTAIHAAVQGHYEGFETAPEFLPHVQGTAKAVMELCGEQAWVAERSFTHKSGYGGKTDLSCPAWVVDFKSKEFDAETKLSTFDEHAMQLVSYRTGLGHHKARCAIGFISVTVPGLCKIIEIPANELERGAMMFSACLLLWKAKNNYWPELAKVAA